MSGHLRKSDYFVADVGIDRAVGLVAAEHYSAGSANTATVLHGLYRAQSRELVGVAWWMPPIKAAAVNVYPTNWQGVLALSRLALRTDVPKNGASFLIGRSIRLIREKHPRWECLVTYADEWREHTGAIYLATNWEYLGKTKPERTYVDAAGRMISRKAGPKTRTHAEMIELGCTMIGTYARHRFRLVLGLRRAPHERQQSLFGAAK